MLQPNHQLSTCFISEALTGIQSDLLYSCRSAEAQLDPCLFDVAVSKMLCWGMFEIIR